MELKDKVRFCSGKDFWHTEEISGCRLKSICITDGPHGVRKQKGEEEMNIAENEVSTCFPTNSLAACSWDRALMEREGEAIGEECLFYGVGMILGPAVNIKRNPLCGRNFEYYSEDPVLSGKLAASWIKGVQRKNIAACVKHFTANNRERGRMNSDSLIDPRALNEIYLKNFRLAVSEGNPVAVMSGYNLLNGEYCSDSKFLLNECLRENWGFKGLTISDWGGVNDRSESFKAGLDLEMPSSKGYFDEKVISDINIGKLDRECVEISFNRISNFVNSAMKNENLIGKNSNFDEHSKLAREIAEKSAVLLKNQDNILPLNKSEKIALIGSLAENFREQGAGSSLINPYKKTSLLDAFKEKEVNYNYFSEVDIKERKDINLGNFNKIVYVMGLTENEESESIDRQGFSLPKCQIELLEYIYERNKNIVVVLIGGSAVDLSFDNKVKGLLNMYLSGQEGGMATFNILYGAVNPSGKLAETYPLEYSDLPSSESFLNEGRMVKYSESLYVGYRYFDTAGIKTKYPFGHGLSYTKFEYSDLSIEINGENIRVSFTVKNTGDMAGEEISQIYVGKPNASLFSPKKELIEFCKTELVSGESKRINVNITKDSFKKFSVYKNSWVLENGKYVIYIGKSSANIALKSEIILTGESLERENASEWYFSPKGKANDKDFESVYGEIPSEKIYKKGNYDDTCTLKEVKDSSFIVKMIYKIIEYEIAKRFGKKDKNNPQYRMALESAVNIPFKNMKLMSADIIEPKVIDAILEIANGRLFKAIKILLKKR